VVKSASRELRVPQESFVMAPAQARAAGLPVDQAFAQSQLVVLKSASLQPGHVFEPGPVPLTFGRSEDNTAVLDADEYASGHHARIEAARDGVWLVDLGSTNGTWANGERVDGRYKLHDGDVLQIGGTELRFER
jgi:pSer/pThr/pTyr-binding forkhead associated (FHA) protein